MRELLSLNGSTCFLLNICYDFFCDLNCHYIIKEDALDHLGNGRMRKSFSPWKIISRIKKIWRVPLLNTSIRMVSLTFDLRLPFGWYKWVLSGNVLPVVVNLQIFVGQCRIRYLQHALESAYFVLELLTIRNSHQPNA